MTQQVKFWFDVSCPFAWATSRWIKEAEKVRDIKITFVPMSLSVLNEGRDLDPAYLEAMEANWGPARVFARVATQEPEKVDELYTAMGTLVHVADNAAKKGYGAYDEIIAQALEQVGLDAAYADIANTTDADADLKRFHQEGIDSVGEDVGTPVIKLGKTAFFGPVITRIPRGEEAGALFDAAVKLAEFPYFFELKRTRTEMPAAE